MKKELLLLVDDESRILRALKALFRSEYQVRTTTDCSEALEILSHERVHTIISDQRMPEMRGVDLLNKAKYISPNTMRLLLTGYSDIPSIMDAINEGEVFRYVTKPWGQDEICSVVSEAMEISNKLFDADQATGFKDADTELVSAKTEILVLDSQTAIYNMVNKLFCETCMIHYSGSIENTIEVFAQHPVKVVIVKVPQGNNEYLSFLKLIKREHPSIVTIAVMADNDAGDIINLINQGQIYRYIPQSVPLGRTRISIQSAIKYANSLSANPVLAERHRVEKSLEPDLINTQSKSRLVKSMSILKKRLLALRTQI